MLPNFVGIGVQRAGTTWVHNCLAEHPQVFVPQIKEVHFFDLHFDRGLDWYASHFASHGHRPAVGEITPNYLLAPQALERLKAVIPEARLFVILREPVSRAYSAYQLFQERYPGLSFRQACEKGSDLLQGSRYLQPMHRLYEHFGQHQVKVMLYDDLEADPAGFLRQLFQFLQVDAEYVPLSCQRRYNRVIYPKAQTAMRKMGLGWAVSLVKASRVGEWIKRRHAVGMGHAEKQLASSDASYLRRLFTDEIRQLQGLINRDLSRWLA